MFDAYLKRWQLTLDGQPFASLNGVLVPVRRGDVRAMLKVSRSAHEKAGARLLAWWEGAGAAPVLAMDDDAVLMLRASDGESLEQWVRAGRDDAATRTICRVVARLHAHRSENAVPALVPLARAFESLHRTAASHGGVMTQCASIAAQLLANPRDEGVLHGDVHHANILHFGQAGWLAIDPKGFFGERGFDYANLFCNPELRQASRPEVFRRRIEIVSGMANILEVRLLQWILAWAGLSAAWRIEDGDDPAGVLALAAKVAQALSGQADGA